MPHRAKHRRRHLAYKWLIAFGVAILGCILLLALPVEPWRRGESGQSRVAFNLSPGKAGWPPNPRIWLDTDAACGVTPRTDPDDCLAILMLALSPRVRIAGVSTVFGNASIDAVDHTVRTLANLLGDERGVRFSIHRGAGGVGEAATPAAHALQTALTGGPLVLLALGPLTNIAAALRDRPDLQSNVAHLIVVMGRREGHSFHPIEGGTASSWFGHGPVFTDFNFRKDPEAAAQILEMDLPVTFMPYEAAREVLLTEADLNRMSAAGATAAWTARHAQGWLEYWRDEIGLPGFYPFDALAATYVLRPDLLRCAPARARVATAEAPFGWFGFRALFVDRADSSGQGITYCPHVTQATPLWISERLAGNRD